jgi:hypothetical protein
MHEMTDREKKYWKIRTALEQLLRVEDDDVKVSPLLEEFLDVTAKIILLYQVDGAIKVLHKGRTEQLERMGVAILKPKK